MELENKYEDGRKKIINYFFCNNILVSKDLLDKSRDEDINELFNKISTVNDPNLLYQELLNKIKKKKKIQKQMLRFFFPIRKRKKKKGISKILFCSLIRGMRQ